jgi:hypothetical protein
MQAGFWHSRLGSADTGSQVGDSSTLLDPDLVMMCDNNPDGIIPASKTQE